MLAIAVLAINLGYAFEGTFTRLDDFPFHSKGLGGVTVGSSSQPGNRFRAGPLAALPVPLPRSYVLGIDVQKWGFELVYWSYLGGQWRNRGWWYYYLYAAMVKVPLGTWALAVLAAALAALGRGNAGALRAEIVLLASLIAVVALASSQTALNQHFRYVLPAAPFAVVWIGGVGRATALGHRAIAALAAAAAAWSIASSLWVYPHCLSYFNELAGGPLHGHAHLLGSNLDWGQDVPYLRDWYQRYLDPLPLGFAHPTFIEPAILGMRCPPPPVGHRPADRALDRATDRFGPQPGWYAVSVNSLRDHGGEYAYFLRFRPVATAGYSIYIYHITTEEANRVRRELALSELDATNH